MRNNECEDHDDEEDPEESGEEGPMNGPTRKEYTPRTKKGIEIARMLVSFCFLSISKSSANTIVVYIGVSMMDKLADFCEGHLKNMFVQWQKCHSCADGKERALILSVSQKDRIRCMAWACQYHCRIFWSTCAFLRLGDPKPYHMIYFLKKNTVS